MPIKTFKVFHWEISTTIPGDPSTDLRQIKTVKVKAHTAEDAMNKAHGQGYVPGHAQLWGAKRSSREARNALRVNRRAGNGMHGYRLYELTYLHKGRPRKGRRQLPVLPRPPLHISFHDVNDTYHS